MSYNWVYSDIYGCDIDRNHAIWSSYEGTWIFLEDAVYSDYLGSYIPKWDAIKVWRPDKKVWDYIYDKIYIGHNRAYFMLGESILL